MTSSTRLIDLLTKSLPLLPYFKPNPIVLRATFSQFHSKTTSTSASNMVGFQEAKEAYLNMPKDEKRQRYKCEDRYSKLCRIIPWPAYAAMESTGDKTLPPLPEGEEKRNVDSEINGKVSLWQGDITTLEIDVIVNAANNTLLGGGGVDGAIHRAAGKYLLDECETLDGCATGGAKITGGYRLPAKYVIHTVGPKGEFPDVLEECYTNSFKLMIENGLKSIAVPCISTGIYEYPNEAAAHVALKTTRDFLEEHKDKVDRVIFTTFLPIDVKVYQTLLQKYFPIE